MDNFSYDVIAFENTKENTNTVRIQEHSSFSGDLGVCDLGVNDLVCGERRNV